MAAKKYPKGPQGQEIKPAIEITVPKLGAKGLALRNKIKAALDNIPTDVLEQNETIIVRADSEGNRPPKLKK
jgi:hypothetical protein